MNIPFKKIHRIAKALENYRGDGRDAVLFDSRDQGNYGNYHWEQYAAMLEKFDPTGLALGMLLAEMIEATIRGSKVELSRVLRDPQFMENLKVIQTLESELQEDIEEPRARLLDRLTESLNRVSPDFGVPGTREVAICLRDAIYSMDSGLTLRWLQCNDTKMAPHVAVCPDIRQFKDLPAFVDALRCELSFGAHLARIGADHTAIGIKQPGKLAYLSSFSIVMGSLRENRAHNHLMAESLDLDTALERYPQWTSIGKVAGCSPVGYDSHKLDHISLLPRDRLLWLAMVIEMAAQQMATTKRPDVALVETMARALPQPPAGANFPAVIEPDWKISELSLEATFSALGLAAWETAFLRPALDGLSEDAFFRMSERPNYGIGLAAKDIVPWSDSNSFTSDKLSDTHVRLIAASPDLAGTREEVETARQELFGHNLLTWLMAWGNHRFEKQCNEYQDWFKAALVANLPAAFLAACLTWQGPEFRVWDNPHLYKQNPKRKGYDPRCFFDNKRAVTKVAYFDPQSGKDLIQMLGLKDEADLPEFLQGWHRDQSWTTADAHSFDYAVAAPYDVRDRWCFSQHLSTNGYYRRFLVATVCVNDASLSAQ